MSAKWNLLSSDPSKARSSHSAAVTHDGLLILYGGELKPRTPVDDPGAIHTYDLRDALRGAKHIDGVKWMDSKAALGKGAGAGFPEPRVGAASVYDPSTQAMYVWGGRGGVDMAPLPEEQAGLWKCTFGAGEVQWMRMEGSGEQPVPRSYHSMVISNVSPASFSSGFLSKQYIRKQYTFMQVARRQVA